MFTRKQKRAGPAAYYGQTKPTPNAWKLQQMRVNKTYRNQKKTINNNNDYGEVWPVNTRNWSIPVGNKRSLKNNSMKSFNKPVMTNAERKRYHKAWNSYFNE